MSEKDDKNYLSSLSKVESAEELYENAPCGYVSFLTDGTIFNINKTLLSWLGFSKEEVIGKKKFNSLFKIGGKIFFETHFFPLIRIQGFIKEINFDIVRNDRTTFPGLLNVNEIENSNGAPKTYRATIFDITDRKIYEKELLEAKKKAENASEARAQFLATISHEIRTPLHAILGMANLLQDTQLTKQQTDYAKILLSSSENLLGLVNNLLDLSKIEAQKVKLEEKPFDLAELIEVLISTYEIKSQEKGIILLQDFQEDLPKDLIGDPIKLNQVLTNLIGNAIKFTEQGHVKLQISALKKDKDHATLRFKVSDTGIGIPKDKLQIIFNEFSQASYEVNRNYGGTGLGLSISQKLLQMHGSELQVKSKLGKGSEFSFELEYRVNKEKKQSQPAPFRENFHHVFKSARILVVDDNPTNIFIVSEYLNQWNFHHDSSESGTKAIEMVQEKKYDIILMDLHMPEINGYETSRQIGRLELEQQPVIIALSASARGDISVKQRRAGINDYVTKPFKPEELFNVLIHHLEKSMKEPGKTVPQESLQQNSESKESKEIINKQVESAAFNLSRFVKMANNQPDFLQKVLTNTAKAFETYLKDFENAAEEKSSEKIRKLLHKSTMSLYYVKADDLTKLLEESAELFSADDQNTAKIEENITAVKAEFSTIISGIKAVDAYEIMNN